MPLIEKKDYTPTEVCPDIKKRGKVGVRREKREMGILILKDIGSPDQGCIFFLLLVYSYFKKMPFLADFIKNWVHFIKNSDVISLVIYQSQPKLH